MIVIDGVVCCHTGHLLWLQARSIGKVDPANKYNGNTDRRQPLYDYLNVPWNAPHEKTYRGKLNFPIANGPNLQSENYPKGGCVSDSFVLYYL